MCSQEQIDRADARVKGGVMQRRFAVRALNVGASAEVEQHAQGAVVLRGCDRCNVESALARWIQDLGRCAMVQQPRHQVEVSIHHR